MNLGNKIIELRKKTNLTQEKLAEKMNVTRQTISSWESDITSPDLNQAMKLATTFKISVSDLLDEKLEIECKENNQTIFKNLIGKECFLDLKDIDHRMNYTTPCKIINIDDNYVKFEFKYSKKTIVKLIDISLIDSFKVVNKKESK